MKNNDELNALLAKADPAKKRKAPKLSDSLIAQGIDSASNLSLRERFELLGQNFKRLMIGAAVSGSAAVVAIALVVSSQPQPLIQLAGLQGARSSESAASQMDSFLCQFDLDQIVAL